MTLSPSLTFGLGITLLILFAVYFVTEDARRKRWIGLGMTLFILAFSIQSIIPLEQRIKLGLDLKGGTSFLMRLVADTDDKGQAREITSDMLDQAVETIRKRVDQFGTGEPVISPQGTDRILVQIPGLDAKDVETARTQLERVAKLEFKLVHENSQQLIAQIDQGLAVTPPGYRIQKQKVSKPDETPERYLVRQRAELDGTAIKAAYPQFDGMRYLVAMDFTREGTKQFGDLTTKNVNRLLAIVLDGELQSAPNIEGPLTEGRAVITGTFTDEEVRNLSSVLENPLQTPVKIDETRSVSATLGKDSVRAGLFAGLLGILIVAIFLTLYYRTAGLIALVGLLVNIAILFGVMAQFGFVLTLPGIAGIILNIGMAVDANVLIYERLREELAAGKSVGAAIEGAFDKAFSAIFDANVTTLITAAILFWQSTGPIKGFAITLTVGIVASVYAALIVTKVLFGWLHRLGGLKELKMMNLLENPRFNFLGKRKAALIFSTVILLGSVAAFVVRGEKNFGVDFRGGDMLLFSMEKIVTDTEARTALGRSDIVVQTEFSGVGQFLQIRAPFNTSDEIVARLSQSFPDSGLVLSQTDNVGPLVGDQLARSSLIALALGLVGILLYVTMRFEFYFALGAIVAVIHDVVITIGLFALFGRELSLVMVGAVLTIAGYSINDTIVVYDRIREELRSGRKGSVQEIMNHSINQTLNRTILTGGTTLLSMVGLYFLGGEALNDFAFAILIGLIVGTYSSVYIAAPVVLWWAKIKGVALDRQVKDAEAVVVQG